MFPPYIHPNVHRFSVFYTKKNYSGTLYPRLHQGITLNPQLQSFLASPKIDVPISFLYYPLGIEVGLELFPETESLGAFSTKKKQNKVTILVK